jgi:hypothetical protein
MSRNFQEVVRSADTIIVGKRIPEITSLVELRRDAQTVIDLIGVPELPEALRPWSGSSTRTGLVSDPAV